MTFKLILLALVATAAAIELHQPLLLKQAIEHEEGPAEYAFSYAVHDEHTGDIKAQKEVRKGDKVEGSYELIDSDGHRRVVLYRADDHSGFEALVKREPTDIKIPIPEQRHKIIGAKILAAPLVHYSQSKLIRSEPRSLDLGGLGHGHASVSVSGLGGSYGY